ncbi:hypothetical protein D7V86_26425 [bacterium D16-51]|nr:hypothetical protein D7V96_26265 [bacterium D16-59]RKI51554.1 hypothetical protein D7V86_26425 [bacterium D16-51]
MILSAKNKCYSELVKGMKCFKEGLSEFICRIGEGENPFYSFGSLLGYFDVLFVSGNLRYNNS